MSNLRFRYRPKDALGLAGLALAYALAIRLVLSQLTADGVISIVWAPSGLGFAALLIGGKKYWPGMLIGAYAAYLSVDRPAGLSVFFALSNALEPLLGIWLLSRFARFDPFLREAGDFLKLAFAGALSAVAATSVGVFSLIAAGIARPDYFFQAFKLWWMGNFLGIVVVAPLLLVWREAPRGWFGRTRIWETAAFFALNFLCGQAVFLGWFGALIGAMAKAHWPFLFVAWGAARFGRHGALLVIALTTLQGLLGALWRVGVFATDIAATQLGNYWFFMLVLTGTGLSLALVLEERDHALNLARVAQEETTRLLDKAEESRWRLLQLVEEQKAAEGALKAERDLSQSYLDTVEATIVALDAAGRVRLINRKGCDLLGYEESELLGKNWFDACLSQTERARVRAVFEEVMRGDLRECEHFENEVLTRGGERRLMAWRNSVLRDPGGEIVGCLGAGEDITERRRADGQLAAQLEELRRWHEVTLGRELRVLELKREVNQLLARLGEPPRYAGEDHPVAGEERIDA
jgi:PAS domain S-box-containing protein